MKELLVLLIILGIFAVVDCSVFKTPVFLRQNAKMTDYEASNRQYSARIFSAMSNIYGGFAPNRFGIINDPVISVAAVASPSPRKSLSRKDLRSVSNTTSGVGYSTGASCGYTPPGSSQPSGGGG